MKGDFMFYIKDRYSSVFTDCIFLRLWVLEYLLRGNSISSHICMKAFYEDSMLNAGVWIDNLQTPSKCIKVIFLKAHVIKPVKYNLSSTWGYISSCVYSWKCCCETTSITDFKTKLLSIWKVVEIISAIHQLEFQGDH